VIDTGTERKENGDSSFISLNSAVSAPNNFHQDPMTIKDDDSEFKLIQFIDQL